MTKIAIITPGYLPVPAVRGGAVEQLIEYLVEENEKYDDFVFDLFTQDHERLKDIVYNNTNIVKIHTSKVDFYIKKILSMLSKLTKRELYVSEFAVNIGRSFDFDKYDIVLVENNMRTYKFLYYKIKKKYIIFHLHNDIDNQDKNDKLAKFISQTATEVLCVSDYIKNRFDETTETDFSKTFYNVIDYKRFSAFEKTKDFNDVSTILYVGRLDEKKGFKQLIEAFIIVLNQNKGKKIKLQLIGECWEGDEESKQYVEKIKNNELLKDKIDFAGYVSNEEINKYYLKAAMVVVPTICEEAFGITAIESILMQRPLIISDSGALPEVTKGAALIVKRDEKFVESLATAILDLLYDEDKRNRLAYIGRQQIIETKLYDKKKYFDNFRKIVFQINDDFTT